MSSHGHKSPQSVVLNNAIANHQAGRLREAEESYRDILQTDPDCAEASHDLGILLMQSGKAKLARPYLKAALERNPEKAQYWLSCADNLLTTDEASAALAVLHQAKRCGLSGFAIDAMTSRAEKLVRSEASDSSGATFRIAVDERVTRIKPDFAELHNNLGKAFEQMGKLDAAVASYELALALRPDVAESYNNLGEVLRKQGRIEAAEANSRRAIAIKPDFAGAHATLGKTLWDSNRIMDGCESFTRSAILLRARRESDTSGQEPVPLYKSRHDQEQREYLIVNDIYRNAAAGTQALHLDESGALVPLALNAINRGDEFNKKWNQASPKMVVIDDFLTKEALEGLRKFCLSSTVWQMTYKGGYLGAFPECGFACPLLGQIADELRIKYATTCGSRPLSQMWAFKYDSQFHGTGLHADFAAVSVNFWITPDTANLDSKSGGLVIWDVAAPLDWEFAKYNSDSAGAREYLKRVGARSVTIPHRSNRAVIFDSDLFHETDKIVFKDGYVNRRVNITLLFGRRETATDL